MAMSIAQADIVQAYECAMTLLPQVVWLGDLVHHRYESLSTVENISTRAAASAILIERYDLALQWLEQGRSIVWTQMLQLRTPLDHLSTVAPVLANELRIVAEGIEGATISEQGLLGGLLDNSARERRRLAADWEQLVNQARSIPGFHDFLQPLAFRNLSQVTRCSTLVAVIMHKDQADAIALIRGSTNIVHIKLPSFANNKAVHIQDHLQGYLQGARALIRYSRRPCYPEQVMEKKIEEVLHDLWVDLVRPILDALGYLGTRCGASDPPRVTWCPTGSLTFLPFHAAGDSRESEHQAYNYMVSSYTPTFSALLRPDSKHGAFRGILAVGQANLAGTAPLPGATIEINKVEAAARCESFTRMEGENATTSSVLNAMKSHSWVHLACHASQSTAHPHASAFHLHDGSLSLSEIIKTPLPSSDFAFLSACETAMGDDKLPDEALHLAAGMLMVGYSSVVATMWSIRDEDAPLVAEQVYAYMLSNGQPNSTRAAMALHRALASLRAKIGRSEYVRWVHYIHMGY